jgi:hypothetical protein
MNDLRVREYPEYKKYLGCIKPRFTKLHKYTNSMQWLAWEANLNPKNNSLKPSSLKTIRGIEKSKKTKLTTTIQGYRHD